MQDTKLHKRALQAARNALGASNEFEGYYQSYAKTDLMDENPGNGKQATA